METLEQINADVVACRRCPRLVAWREAVAASPPARFRGEPSGPPPLPGSGDPQARRLVVGLPPAANGGTRRGRMFPGAPSGDWLSRALPGAGSPPQAPSRHEGDGLALNDCY